MSEEATPVVRRPAAELSGVQRRYLRGLAHHLNPVVMVGAGGLSEGVIDKTITELERHELIKVKFPEKAAKTEAPKLADASGSHLAQVIGRIGVLYRQREKKAEIKLPKA